MMSSDPSCAMAFPQEQGGIAQIQSALKLNILESSSKVYMNMSEN